MLSRSRLFFVFFVISTSAWAVTATDYYQAGNAFYQQGQWEKAAQYYRAAIQADPSMWQAQMGLGNADYRLGRSAEALQAYDQSLALHPDNPTLKAFADKLRPQGSNKVPLTSPGDSWTTPPSSAPPAFNPGLPDPNNGSANSAGLPGVAASPTPGWRMENKLSKMSGLPKRGSIAFEAGTTGTIGGTKDMSDFYGPGIYGLSSLSYGGGFYLGADYTLMPNAQIGLQFQGLYKVPYIVQEGSYDYDTWREFAIGGVVVGRGLLPLSSNINMILHLEGGLYSLVFSGTDFTYMSSWNYSASNFGGMAGLELEILQNISGTWALDFGLGYRFLNFSPITATSGGSSGTLTKYYGGDASLDFSGLNVSAGVRFY